MAELDTTTIARRSVQGVLALVSRSLVINAVSLVTQLIILPLFLDSRALGVFTIVNAIIAFLVYFSDIGLAGALIQKKEEVDEDDLKTAFTIQQGLVLGVVLIAFLASNVITSFYKLDTPGRMLFYALLISFILSSLKTIPSVILERKLEFNKLIIPQLVETIAFNLTLIPFVIFGFGITSFTIAVLLRGLSGLITIYIIVPWRPAIGFKKQTAKKLVSFGAPFQANSILALFKDDLLVLILGKVLTYGEIGYVFAFAQKWAYVPLRFAMDNIVRITFPSYSRLQHDPYALKRALEKSLFIIVSFVGPSLVGLVILMPYFIHIFPKYLKWEPALLSLTFFAANALLSSISTPLTNFLNSIGKIKTTLKLMIFWTVSTWIATFLGIYFFGFNGIAIASFIVSLSVVYVIHVVRKTIPFDVVKSLLPPLVASAIMAVVMYFTAPMLAGSLVTFLLSIVLGGAVYSITLFILAGKELRSDLRFIRSLLKKESK